MTPIAGSAHEPRRIGHWVIPPIGFGTMLLGNEGRPERKVSDRDDSCSIGWRGPPLGHCGQLLPSTSTSLATTRRSLARRCARGQGTPTMCSSSARAVTPARRRNSSFRMRGQQAFVAIAN